MNVQEFNEKYLMNRPRCVSKSGEIFDYLNPMTIPSIVCKDGFKVSVQVGSSHYCSPRSVDGPWYQVELGFPNKVVQEWMDYIEDYDQPLDTVYAYVPIQLVIDAFESHGGIDEKKTILWSDNSNATKSIR